MIAYTATKRKRNLKRTKERIFLFLMLALPVAQWLVFWLYINFSAIELAFMDPRTGAFTFANFKTFWEGLTSPAGDIRLAVKNTFIYFGTSAIIILPISIVISYFFFKRIFGYKVYRIIFYLPAIISSVAMTTVFANFIVPKGPLDHFLRLFGTSIRPEGLLGNKDTATWTIAGYCIWTGFCGNVLLFGGAMSRVPLDVLESAKLEGCSAWRELISIVLPLITPTITTQIVLLFTSMFTATGPILLFTNGRMQTTTISFWIFRQVYGEGAIGGSGSYNLVSATGLCFTAVSVPIILFIRWLLGKVPTVEY